MTSKFSAAKFNCRLNWLSSRRRVVETGKDPKDPPVWSERWFTSMHCGLQTQQQVGQASLSGSRHVGVHAAVVLPQIRLAGFSQRVAHLVVLSDQLLPGGQCFTALRRHRRSGSSRLQRLKHNVVIISGSISVFNQKQPLWSAEQRSGCAQQAGTLDYCCDLKSKLSVCSCIKILDTEQKETSQCKTSVIS